MAVVLVDMTTAPGGWLTVRIQFRMTSMGLARAARRAASAPEIRPPGCTLRRIGG